MSLTEIFLAMIFGAMIGGVPGAIGALLCVGIYAWRNGGL